MDQLLAQPVSSQFLAQTKPLSPTLCIWGLIIPVIGLYLQLFVELSGTSRSLLIYTSSTRGF